MDLSLLPKLTLSEKFVLQHSDAKDLFVEKFEHLIQQKMLEGDWKTVGELAHKMKPSVQFVGMDSTLEKARSIEHQCREPYVCSDQVSLLVSDVTEETQTAIIALQEVLSNS